MTTANRRRRRTAAAVGFRRTPPPRRWASTISIAALVVAVAVAAIEIVSSVPSTEGFTCVSPPVTPAKLAMRGRRSGRSASSGEADRETAVSDVDHEAADDTAADDDEDDGSSSSTLGYVLKERNPYDVHVYYATPEERERALELRSKMRAAFGTWMRFYGPKDRPIGPHPVPMWEADFGGYENRNRFTEVRDFLRRENAGDLSVLIHPHSIDSDFRDHTDHAFWDGPVLPLRIGGWRR